MIHLKSGIVAVVVFAFSIPCFSQVKCGTSVSSAQIAREKTYTLTPLTATQSLPQVNRDLSIVLYVVKDSTNNARISIAAINEAITKLNSYFVPISLKFHLSNLIYVDNYQFNYLVEAKNEKDLTISYSTPNVINIYLVGKIQDRFLNMVNGLTYMPADAKDYLIITKTSFNTSEIAHQIGHFFNLYHTHETIFGNELVGTLNCSTTGDLCCDTDADPKLMDMVSSDCLYMGTIKDSNNKYYTPSVKNFMSFSNLDCRCFFSKTQYLRMVYAIGHYKNTLK